MKPYLSLSVIPLVLLCAIAPTSSPTPPAPLPGKLLIIGGNIGDSANLIFSTLAANAPEGSTIGVIPTASGEPEASAASALKSISTHAPKHKVITIPLVGTSSNSDAAFVAQIRSCDALYFTGGQQDRITELFRPNDKPTPISDAVEAVLAKGGIVSGSSAGAAIMSTPMINGGTSQAALSPRTSTAPATPPGEEPTASVPLIPGMGYFKYGIVDQHFLQRGRAGRLLVALELTNNLYGFGVSEGRGILVDRTAHTLTAVGDDAIFFLDRTRAVESQVGDSRSNLRVSLLSSGDVVSLAAPTPSTTPHANKTPLTSPTASPTTLPADAKPFETLVIRDALHYLATSQSKAPLKLTTSTISLEFTADADTRFYQNPKRPGDLTVINLRLDVVATHR